MDLSDLWQENKSFLLKLGAALVLFGIGYATLQALYGDELRSLRAERVKLESELRRSRYSSADRDVARRENDALREAIATLEEAVAWKARPAFRLDDGQGSPASQYHRIVSDVREELLLLANRRNLVLDEGLGLPRFSPTRVEEIERFLAGLDAVDRALRLALDTGVRRVEELSIKLDPELAARAGVGTVERTRVRVALVGPGLSLSRFLLRSQRVPEGERLLVESFELFPARHKDGEVRLELVLVVPRVHPGAWEGGEV